MSLLLKPLKSWTSSLRGTLLLSQRQMNSSKESIEQSPSKDNVEDSKISTQDDKPDDLFRHLWIRCSGHERTVLDSYEKFLTLAAQHLGVQHVRTEEPFRYFKRRTLLASRFVHKKCRVQYEIRNYYRDLLFKNITGSTADTFLEYVERNIPEGVLFIAEKHRLAELPFELEGSNQSTQT